MQCKRCYKEWELEETGLFCPVCHTQAHPDADELSALFRRAACAEQDKKYEEASRRYALLALAGVPEGEEAYARCFEAGLGVPRDLARAADGYLDAAEHGSPRAAYRLGRLLRGRSRLAVGRGSAAFWLCAAAALGSADAAWLLARRGKKYGLDEKARRAMLAYAASEGHKGAIRRLTRTYLWEKDPASALSVYKKLPSPGRIALLVLRLLCKDAPAALLPAPLPMTAERMLLLGEEALAGGFHATSLRLFLLAAGEGSLPAAISVGRAYHEGIGTQPNLTVAIDFYRRAAQGGSAEAAFALASIMESEKKNPAEAEVYYLRAAELGTAEHQYALAEFYLERNTAGEGVRRAVPWLRRATSGGCLPAAERLAAIDAHVSETYRRAVEEQKAGNVQKAFALYERAAALGHAASLSNLGYCLQKGIGCQADPGAAARAYREAVAAGSEVARVNLAVCYVNGLGVGRDFSAARALLEGLSDAYRDMAEPLLASISENAERKRAHRLYLRAAAAYHAGRVTEALRLRLAAAKAGSARAAYMLGCHFEFGDGVTLDREKAAAWYEAAAASGFMDEGSRLKGGHLREARRLSQA